MNIDNIIEGNRVYLISEDGNVISMDMDDRPMGRFKKRKISASQLATPWAQH